VLEHYLSLLVKSIFVENILLAYFLGMCSFLAISKKVDTSIGLGLAVVFVLTITAPVNWALHHYFLEEGALAWAGLPNIDLSYLNFIAFIAVIAAMVQLVELGGSLFLVERQYTLGESTIFGAGSGLGFFLAITSMAAIRHKLRYANVPKGLRGLGITMLLTGLLSMAFMAFSGIDL
jgi:Na+-transporting NADH:ubiquinone oxidoreductase subunit E